MRILLYTGKGGTGKTTAAAATALRAAELGYRTVVVSTDAAHSLADSLETELGPEPTLVAPNLWGQETDVYYNLEKYWGTIQGWLKALLAWQGMDELVAEDIALVPGMEELANLLWVNRHAQSGEFDLVIVDCAPTGETLRLLAFPESAHWWVDKVLPVERRLAQVFGPVIHPLTGMPVPKREVFDAAQELLEQLIDLYRLLSDRAHSSVRVVVNPERMVIRESQRLFTYLNLYGYVTDAIICNRLLPDSLDHRFFGRWQKAQRAHYRLIEEAFAPIPILTAPLMPDEVVGTERLRELAAHIFGDEDPTRIFYPWVAQEVRSEDGRMVLSLGMPFVSKAEISLAQRGDELMVRVGPHTRNVLLPHSLAGRTATGARMEGDRLYIYFEKSD
ncbi:MAG: ArsA family ATPase [Dehalococcoidia bacterium]